MKHLERKWRLPVPTALSLAIAAVGCILSPLADWGYAEASYWAAAYGDAGTEGAWSIQSTTDGGCVVTGYSTSFGAAGASRFWVLKLASTGAVQWQKAYNHDWDLPDLVIQTLDGGFAVVGYTERRTGSNWDVWILKLDGGGAIQWQKIYGGQNDDVATSIQQTIDGGYVVAGETKSWGAGDWDIWILKLDANGAIQWQKAYGGPNWDSTSADPIQQTADGGYVVAGRTASYGSGGFDVWILKLDGSGAIQWQKAYGGSKDEMARAVRQAADGGYVAAGYKQSVGRDDYDVWVLKLDANGAIQWQKAYGGPEDEFAYSIWETADGGYALAGSTESFGAGSMDAWFLKLDGNGAIQWQKTCGGSRDDGADAIRQTADGDYVVAGMTESFGAGDRDFLVLRLNGQGDIPECSLLKSSTAKPVATGAAVLASQAKVSFTGAVAADTSVISAVTDASVNFLCQASTLPAQVIALWPPETAAPGSATTLWAQVMNSGASPFPASANVWFFIWGPNVFQWAGAASAAGLTPGAAQWYSLDWAVPSYAGPGTYSYWAVVATDEGYISDWSAAQGFTVVDSDAWAKITGLKEVGTVAPGGSARFGATVWSTGLSALPWDAYVCFFVYGPGTYGWAGWSFVAGLAPGAWQNCAFDWAVPGGTAAGTFWYWAVVMTTEGAYLSNWSAGLSFTVK